MNKEIIDDLLFKFPVLEIALQAGTISIKMVREMLDVDRYYMQDLYKKLVMARAVIGVSSSTFKGTPELLAYLKERAENVKTNGN